MGLLGRRRQARAEAEREKKASEFMIHMRRAFTNFEQWSNVVRLVAEHSADTLPKFLEAIREHELYPVVRKWSEGLEEERNKAQKEAIRALRTSDHILHEDAASRFRSLEVLIEQMKAHERR